MWLYLAITATASLDHPASHARGITVRMASAWRTVMLQWMTKARYMTKVKDELLLVEIYHPAVSLLFATARTSDCW
jgi:hypothetical protein